MVRFILIAAALLGGCGKSTTDGGDGAQSELASAVQALESRIAQLEGQIAQQDDTTASMASIVPGGALVLGQDQDAVGGGFEPEQAFVGRLDEVSVYARVLSAQEVRDHYVRLGVVAAWAVAGQGAWPGRQSGGASSSAPGACFSAA